jgi:hypothetical protein
MDKNDASIKNVDEEESNKIRIKIIPEVDIFC